MDFVLLGLTLLSAIALGEAIYCKDLPRVPHDASKTLTPFGDKWVISHSNMPSLDKCINIEYCGNRNFDPQSATVLFKNKPKNGHLDYKVNVNKYLDEWSLHGELGPDMNFRKLEIDYLSEYFMIYTCDLFGKNIEYFRGVTTNKQGVDKIQARLDEFQKNNSLPFADNIYPFNVWDKTTCDTPSFKLADAPLKLGPLDASLPPGTKRRGDGDDTPNFLNWLPDWMNSLIGNLGF